MSVDDEDSSVVEESSPTDVLKQADGKQTVQYVVGVFASVGVGVGLTGLLAAILIEDTIGTATIIANGTGSLIVSFFGGSILAAILALDGTFDIGYNTSKTYVLSFASTAAGYFAMMLLTIILTSVPNSGPDIGTYLIGAVFLSLSTGVAAVLIVWLHHSMKLQPVDS